MGVVDSKCSSIFDCASLMYKCVAFGEEVRSLISFKLADSLTKCFEMFFFRRIDNCLYLSTSKKETSGVLYPNDLRFYSPLIFLLSVSLSNWCHVNTSVIFGVWANSSPLKCICFDLKCDEGPLCE